MPAKPVWSGLVSAIVIHHQVHVQAGRNTGVERAQKPEKLLAVVPAMQFADHLTTGKIQGGEQCGGIPAHIVMGTTLAGPLVGMAGYGPMPDLALLVNAQHHGFKRWVKV